MTYGQLHRMVIVARQLPDAAFTLIEVMAVIVITTILTTAVMVSLAGSARMASMKNVIEHLGMTDHLVREQAQRSGKPVQFRVNMSAGKIVRIEESQEESTLYELPVDVQFTKVRTVTANDGGPIVCSSLGITPTYAIAVERKNGPTQCVVFAGLTGDIMEVKDDKELDDIFDVLAPPDEIASPAGHDTR